jgi:P pilus assembly chaperone PapD
MEAAVVSGTDSVRMIDCGNRVPQKRDVLYVLQLRDVHKSRASNGAVAITIAR